MTYTFKIHRLGMTAIAAALALSSTRLAAQEAPVEQPDAEAPAEAAADPLAPAPEGEPAAPVVESPDAPADPLAPVLAEEAGTGSEAVSAESPESAAANGATKSTTKTIRRAQRFATQAVEPIAEPLADEAVSAGTTTVVPLEEIAAIPDARPVEKSTVDDALPVAGGAGALILALAGTGIAVHRRRRRREEAQFDLWQDEAASAKDSRADPEPLWSPPIVEPKPAPAPAVSAATEVPDGFDTSNLGKHVLAAYRGPTPENPSMSLRDRLTIAAELDRREREARETRSPPPSQTKPVTARPAPKIQSLSFSFSGTPTQLKWPQSPL